MAVTIEYVGKPPKLKRHPKILSSQNAMMVEKRLSSRRRHPRSKLITDETIMKSEEWQRRLQLVRSMEES